MAEPKLLVPLKPKEERSSKVSRGAQLILGYNSNRKAAIESRGIQHPELDKAMGNAPGFEANKSEDFVSPSQLTESEYKLKKSELEKQREVLLQQNLQNAWRNGDWNTQLSDVDAKLTALDKEYASGKYAEAYDRMSAHTKASTDKLGELVTEQKKLSQRLGLVSAPTAGKWEDSDQYKLGEINKQISAIRKQLAAEGYTEAEIDSLSNRSVQDYNAEQTKAMRESAYEKASDRSGAGNLVVRIANDTAAGVGAVDLLVQNLLAGKDAITGQRELVDYNTGAQQFVHRSDAVTKAHNENIAENMAKKHGAETEEAAKATNRRVFMNDILASMGTSGASIALSPILGPTAAAMIQGSSAAAKTMHEYHNNGYTDGQALTMGLLAGAIETATEKIGIDSLFNLKNIGGLTGKELMKQLALNIGKQGSTEGMEEGLSTILNTLAESIVLADENTIRRDVDALVAQGMGRKEAEKQVMLNWVKEFGASVLGGFISGGLFGVGGSLINLSNKTDAKVQQQADEQIAEQATTEETSEPESPLIVQPEQKTEPVAQTEEVPDSPLIIQQEQKTGPIPGTRPHAEAILASPELRAQFEKESGVQLKGTKSEQRNAVLEYYRNVNQGTTVEAAEPVSPLIVQQEQPVAEAVSPLIVEDTPAPQELPADGMEAQADTFGHSVGAATPSYGPQVPTQSKPVTDSNWMPEEAKEMAQPGTHERISEARSIGLAESMFAVDEYGNVVNAAEVAEDLLSMADGTWSGVDSDGAMMAAQELWKQGDEAGFNKIMDRYNREGTHEGQAMQAREKWVHTPAGKVAKAQEIISAVVSDGRNKVKAKQAEAEIAEVKKAIEEAVPDAANVAVSEEAYDIVYEIVKQAEKPRPRKGDDRHWTAQLADILASRVDVKEPSHRTKSLTQQMLDDLLRLTKDAAPKHTGGVAPQNPAKHTETFQNYLQNRAHYEQAVSWAQKAVFEKYSDNPEMLSAFEEWFNNGISLRNTLNGVIKEHGVDINNILRKSWEDKAAAVNQIKANILTNSDLTDKQRNEAAEIIHGRFWQEVSERSRAAVERFTAPPKTETTKKTAKQNLEEMANLGAFEMDDLGDKVIEKIINQTARENTERINAILTQNVGTKEAAVNQIADLLLSDVDLSADQVSTLRKRVVDSMNREIEKRNAKAVAKYVEPSKSRAQTTQMERFVAMYNRGAFDSVALRDAVYEKMGLPVLTAKDTRQIYSLMEQAQQLREADPRQAEKLEQTANKIIASKVPVEFKNKVIRLLMDNMLGNFRTLITRNAGGNLIFAIPEAVAKVPTAVVDAAVSLKTKDRYYAMPDMAQAKAYGKGFAKGATETIEDFKWDLHTPRSGETLDYKAQIQPFSNWACRNIDKMVQTGLEIGDRPFYEANYEARMAELNKLAAKGQLPPKMQENFAALAPVEARLSALEAVFQSEGKMAKGLTQIKGGVQDIMEASTGIGLGGQFSVPFTRTPGNILQRTLEYLPGISTLKNTITTGKEIARGEFDQRRFSRETGRNITGAGIAYLAAQAVKAGLVTGGGDDRPDEELLDQSGWQEYSVKIGDKYLSYDWIPILGPVLAGTADFMGALDDDVENPLLHATGTGLQAAANMSALSGVGRLFGGYNGVVSGFGDALLSGTSQAVPSLVRQAARATDKYERSTYDPNKLKQQWNYIKSGIPGLRQTLPVQYDLFGNPIEVSDGRGAGAKWFENLLSPSYISEEQHDPRTDEMLRLRDAGYNVPVPEISKSRDIDGNGVNDKLTADELSAFTRSRNSTFGELASAFIRSDYYKSLKSDQDKSSLLSVAMDYSSKMAAAELYKGRGEDYSVDSWMAEAAESSDPAKYILLYTGAQSLEPYGDNKNPSTWQKIEYISKNTNTEQADEFIPLFMTGNYPARYRAAREIGTSPEVFAKFYAEYTQNNGAKGATKEWALANRWSEGQFNYMYNLFKAGEDEIATFNDQHR